MENTLKVFLNLILTWTTFNCIFWNAAMKMTKWKGQYFQAEVWYTSLQDHMTHLNWQFICGKIQVWIPFKLLKPLMISYLKPMLRSEWGIISCFQLLGYIEIHFINYFFWFLIFQGSNATIVHNSRNLHISASCSNHLSVKWVIFLPSADEILH